MSTLALNRPRGLTLSWPDVASALPLAFVAFAGAAFSLTPAVDSDLGWHLRAGQLTLATHHVTRVDPFSHTMAGQPWVDNEWLWETAVAALNGLAGTIGLVVANAILVALAMALVYATLRLRRVSTLLAVGGTLLALINLAPYGDVRPGMVGVLCAAAMLFFLEKHRGTRNWRWLLALPGCELVWANCHGSYILGLLLGGIYGLAALWQEHSWRQLLGYAGLAAALLATSLLNPIGFGLTRFTLFASRLTFNREFVQAWTAPDLHDTAMLPLLATLLLTLGLPLLWPAARLPKAESLLLLASTLATLQSKEFIPLYAVAAAPLVVQLAQPIVRWSPAWKPSALHGLTFAICAAILATVPIRNLTPAANAEALAKLYPVSAVQFIQQQQLPGPMWNNFNWGGYLLTALPRLPVLVDSRTEMYGDTFLNHYLDVASAKEPPDAMLDQYGIKLVLVASDSRLAGELGREAGWQQVYQDKIAAVFTRSSS